MRKKKEKKKESLSVAEAKKLLRKTPLTEVFFKVRSFKGKKHCYICRKKAGLVALI